jgi:hypothetical protein
VLNDSGQISRLEMALRLGVHEILVKPIWSKTVQLLLFGIIFNPWPMVLADGNYVPLPRRRLDAES